MSSSARKQNLLFVDIGANLLDPMFSGNYRGKQRHESDFDSVLSRAWDNHLDKIIISAGTLEESKQALSLARSLGSNTFSTVGVHPTRCGDFPEGHVEELLEVCRDGMKDGTVVALGELGLDYDRLEFCSKENQHEGFLAQLHLAEETKLPLFLHNRNTGRDLIDVLRNNRERFSNGVVHSFDDSIELANEIIDLGLYVGINGCSLKTPDNLEVIKQIPLEKILLETDCPWCGIKQSHAGYEFIKTNFPTKTEKKFEPGNCVKNRNEPCYIIQVAEVISGVKGVSLEEVAEVCWKNSYDLFGGFEKKT